MPASEIDRLDLGVVLDLVRRAVLEDAAVVHHRHALGDPQRHVEVVLDDDIADVADGSDVRIATRSRRSVGDKPGGRLVEQDEARRAGERQADFELPLLAVAELARPAVPPTGVELDRSAGCARPGP